MFVSNLADAQARHAEQLAAHRKAAAVHDRAKAAVAAIVDRAARGEAASPADLEAAERAEQHASRAARLVEARTAATRLAVEHAEIAELHSQAEHLRADFVAAADALVAASGRADAHLAAVRAALNDRSAAAVKLQVAERAGGLFDHEEMDAKARENAALAKLHPGERPRCGVRLGAFPERLAGAHLLDGILKEPVQFASLAARDAGALGRPVPDPATTASPTTVA